MKIPDEISFAKALPRGKGAFIAVIWQTQGPGSDIP